MTSIYAAASRTLSNRLRTARKALGFNQVDAAKRLKRTQSYISKVEAGQLRLDVVQLKAFAKLYKVPLSHLVK